LFQIALQKIFILIKPEAPVWLARCANGPECFPTPTATILVQEQSLMSMTNCTTEVVVFVVDSTAQDRLPEAQRELVKLLAERHYLTFIIIIQVQIATGTFLQQPTTVFQNKGLPIQPRLMSRVRQKVAFIFLKNGTYFYLILLYWCVYNLLFKWKFVHKHPPFYNG